MGSLLDVSIEHTLVLGLALTFVLVELLWIGCANAIVARSPFGQTEGSNGLHRLSIVVLCYLLCKWLVFVTLASVSLLTLPAYIVSTLFLSIPLLLSKAKIRVALNFLYSSLEDIKPLLKIPLWHPLSIILILFWTVTFLQQWHIVSEPNQVPIFTSGIGLKTALYVKHQGFFSQPLTNYWDFKQATPGNLEGWYASIMVFKFDFLVRVFILLLYALIPLPIIGFRPAQHTNTARWLIALLVWAMPPLRRALISCSWEIPMCFLFALAALSAFSYLSERTPKHLVILGFSVGLALGIHLPTAIPLMVLVGCVSLYRGNSSIKLMSYSLVPLLAIGLPWLVRNTLLEGIPWAPYLPQLGPPTHGQAALADWLAATPLITARTDGLLNQLIRLFFLADSFEMGPIVAVCFYYCSLSAYARFKWHRQEILFSSLVIAAAIPLLVTKSVARLAENGDIGSYLIPSALLALFFTLRAKGRDEPLTPPMDDPHEILFALILAGSLAYRATQITGTSTGSFLPVDVLIFLSAIGAAIAGFLFLKGPRYIPWCICIAVATLWLTDSIYQNKMLTTLRAQFGLSKQQARSIYYGHQALATNEESTLVWHSPPFYLLLGRHYQNDIASIKKPLPIIEYEDLSSLDIDLFVAMGSPLQTSTTQLGAPMHTDASFAIFPIDNN